MVSIVADPHHFDPDPDALFSFYYDPDPDPASDPNF